MLIFVIKAINKCNADCIYCFSDKKGKLEKFSLELLSIFYERINEYLIKNPLETIEIQWHGGEPLLLGTQFFKKVLQIQREVLVHTTNNVSHSMQSNITLLTKELLEVLAEMGLKSIGTSFEHYGSIRKLKSKRIANQYNDKFLNAMRLIEASPFVVGINYVVTKNNLDDPGDTFYMLTNLNPSGSISFNPLKLSNKQRLSHLSIEPQEFNLFIQELFPLWQNSKNNLPSIEPLHTLWKTGENLKLQKSIFVKEIVPIILKPNGDFAHSRKPELNLGNISGKKIREVIELINCLHNKIKSEISIKRECLKCQLKEWCQCNLNSDSYSQNDDLKFDQRWCNARKEIIFNYILS